MPSGRVGGLAPSAVANVEYLEMGNGLMGMGYWELD